MALYMCTRFNYAHREMESEGFEASSDDLARTKAFEIAKEHQWVQFELHDRARLVICLPPSSAER